MINGVANIWGAFDIAFLEIWWAPKPRNMQMQEILSEMPNKR